MRSAARGLVALVALVGAACTAAAEPTFAVTVHFTPSERSQLLIRAMTDEASAIWAPYGVNFIWSTVRDDDASGCLDGSFNVIVQRRRPRAYAKSGQTVLGFTRLPGPSIDHAPVIIDRDGVDQTLEWLTADRLAAAAGHHTLWSPDVGRALGRVLAHEVGHVLLAQAGHQPEGLMRASYGADELAGMRRETFTLSPAEIERLRARLDALRESIDANTRAAIGTPADR
jgi:hypothetical protein